jgi:hypothetical protein
MNTDDFTRTGNTPMDRIQDHASTAEHSGPAATPSFNAFDPDDAGAGDMMFLPGDTALFDDITQALRAPVDAISPADRPFTRTPVLETAFAISPGFATGAILQTDKGSVAVQDLQPGDRVLTRDKGFQPVLWVGRSDLIAPDAEHHPVAIAQGALGPNLPDRDMILPASHRLLIEGPRTKLMFGTREVFVPVAHLVGYPGITFAPEAPRHCTQVLCAAHEVLWCDGIWAESLQYTTTNNPDQPVEKKRFSEIGAVALTSYQSARRTLLRHEADLLLA